MVAVADDAHIGASAGDRLTADLARSLAELFREARHECSAGGVGVARREIVERSRSRALHISLAVLLLFSVGGAVAAAPLRGHTRPTGSPSPERARLR